MIWPSTEAQERHNEFVDWQLRERDAYEDAREEREERNRIALSLRPHKFSEALDIPGFCVCGVNQNGDIHQ
jgi:hypothetical protein